MIERLEIIKKRYEELNNQLLDPSVLSNINKTREISKEASSLEDTVTCFNEYKETLSDIDAAREMLSDADMEEFAKGVHQDAARPPCSVCWPVSARLTRV